MIAGGDKICQFMIDIQETIIQRITMLQNLAVIAWSQDIIKCYFELSFATRSSHGCVVDDAQRIFPDNGTVILDPNSTFVFVVTTDILFSIVLNFSVLLDSG